MVEYKIRDEGLAEHGKLMIEWAERNMPVLMQIRDRFRKEKPLEGLIASACLHVTKETAVLLKTLMTGGAEVYVSASNPLSTQDDVAAALVEEGINVFAWRGMNKTDYYDCLEAVASRSPKIVLDDGGDLTVLIHQKGWAKEVWGGCEETTTGINRLMSLASAGRLSYPVIAVNNAQTKWDFDNVYGTGQSTIDGILRATNVLLAGKTFVVAGYGHCGRGLAMRARGMGAKVIVTEVDPIKALRAHMDGYYVMPMSKASEVGDIFVTVTGNKNVIRREHIERMKDGAILANSGHFNVEIDLQDLEDMTIKKRKIRENLEEYELKNGRRIYLLSEGRLVNLSAAEGHPSEVMDMSFSNQALSAEYLVKNKGKLKPAVYDVPLEIDRLVASLKLKALGIEIDELTEEQIKYLRGFEEGT